MRYRVTREETKVTLQRPDKLTHIIVLLLGILYELRLTSSKMECSLCDHYHCLALVKVTWAKYAQTFLYLFLVSWTLCKAIWNMITHGTPRLIVTEKLLYFYYTSTSSTNTLFSIGYNGWVIGNTLNLCCSCCILSFFFVAVRKKYNT